MSISAVKWLASWYRHTGRITSCGLIPNWPTTPMVESLSVIVSNEVVVPPWLRTSPACRLRAGCQHLGIIIVSRYLLRRSGREYRRHMSCTEMVLMVKWMLIRNIVTIIGAETTAPRPRRVYVSSNFALKMRDHRQHLGKTILLY
jgi:hypothetical protein